MKLTIAMAAALILCSGSLMARAAIVHRRAAEERALAAAEAAKHTPRLDSEASAMSGVDVRLGARLHHLAVRSEKKHKHA